MLFVSSLKFQEYILASADRGADAAVLGERIRTASAETRLEGCGHLSGVISIDVFLTNTRTF